ncbi:MAG: NYN domain-containing protein [Candidatus Gracilibacteria bacterium]|nr:NYN domain-containing protein [Candidatus Gracilibacteria bacterium]
MIKQKNYAFIDGQNLHLGTTTEGWNIDPIKFRIYLKDKYKIEKAYYFLGHVIYENNPLYTRLQEAGFIVVFKKQMEDMITNKKGNIDSDLIFHVMEKLLEDGKKFDKIVLISGDGDFKILVDYLIRKNRLEKILFPNKKFTSSMYKSIELKYKDFLTNLKNKIEYKKHKKKEAS